MGINQSSSSVTLRNNHERIAARPFERGRMIRRRYCSSATALLCSTSRELYTRVTRPRRAAAKIGRHAARRLSSSRTKGQSVPVTVMEEPIEDRRGEDVVVDRCVFIMSTRVARRQFGFALLRKSAICVAFWCHFVSACFDGER
jgi:hypothetical protein